MRTPAAVRFLSCEPLLGPVDVSRFLSDFELGRESLPPRANLHWIIAGAESGPATRPMEMAWVRKIKEDCQAANVAFFFKQAADEHGRKIHTPELDGRRYVSYPQVNLGGLR